MQIVKQTRKQQTYNKAWNVNKNPLQSNNKNGKSYKTYKRFTHVYVRKRLMCFWNLHT